MQDLQDPAASSSSRAQHRRRRRARGWCREWCNCVRTLCTLACLASFVVVVFYVVVYTGKAALWCLSVDHHHNHTIAIIGNATRVNVPRVNATRARHIDWSPASIHFGHIFMGIVAVLMCALGLVLARKCCCAG